jgi:hypothetical protein
MLRKQNQKDEIRMRAIDIEIDIHETSAGSFKLTSDTSRSIFVNWKTPACCGLSQRMRVRLEYAIRNQTMLQFTELV